MVNSLPVHVLFVSPLQRYTHTVSLSLSHTHMRAHTIARTVARTKAHVQYSVSRNRATVLSSGWSCQSYAVKAAK